MKSRDASKTRDEVLHEFRIQAIREAAGRVVAERGVEGTTMDAIADAAGIAKGTIYLYFKNREDLLEKTADHAFTALVEEIESTLGTPRPFREQLGALVLGTLKFFDAQRNFFRLYRAVLEHSGRCDVRYEHPQFHRYLAGLTQWIATAAERGEAVAAHPERVAAVLAEALHAVLLRRTLDEHSLPVEEEAQWLSSLLCDGIAPKGEV